MSSAACSFGSHCTRKETSSEEEVPGGRSHSSRAGVEGRPVSWKSRRSVVPFAFTLSLVGLCVEGLRGGALGYSRVWLVARLVAVALVSAHCFRIC